MLLPDCIAKRLHRIAENEKFIDYKFETKPGSNATDNLLGVMLAVTINGIRELNGKIESDKLSLICKMPPNNLKRRKIFKIDKVFDREIYTYSKLLPTFVQFQKDKGLSDIDSFISFPKIYAAEYDEEDDTHILIMEDLRAKNYEMWPKAKTIRFDLQMAAMNELGKFHACSFAIKDQRPDEFAEFKELSDNFKEVFSNKMKTFLIQSIERVARAMKDPFHKELVEHFQNTFEDTMNNCFLKEVCDQFGVVGHGDCWNNNFLFRCDGEKVSFS